MGKASDFFGMEFNTAPAPTAEPAAEAKPTSLLGRAEAFFGRVFSSPPGSPRPEPKKAPVAPVAQPDGNRAPKPNAVEKDMAKDVMFTPQEQRAVDAYQNKPSTRAYDVASIERELSKTKDPKTKAILEEELAKRKK